MTTSLIGKALRGFAVSAALVAGSALAQADQTPQAHSLDWKPVTVRFSDLDTQSPQGARILYARIRRAAGDVCTSSITLWDSSRTATWNKCYRMTVADAVQRIDRATLTAQHLRSGMAKSD